MISKMPLGLVSQRRRHSPSSHLPTQLKAC